MQASSSLRRRETFQRSASSTSSTSSKFNEAFNADGLARLLRISIMTSQAELEDPLWNLRTTIAKSTTPILSTSEAPTDTTDSLANATHIAFNYDTHHKSFSLTSETRFAPGDQPIDLRSIYFAWQNKDASLPDYISAVQHLNEELPSGAGGSVQNLSFAQKIELIAWLSGETETSESIKPLEGAGVSVDAEKSAAIASGKAGGVAVDSGGEGKALLDERLMVIYDGERKMGDHNTVLRGTKPIVSSTRPCSLSYCIAYPRNVSGLTLDDVGLLHVPHRRKDVRPHPTAKRAHTPHSSKYAPWHNTPGLQPPEEAPP